MPWPAGTTLRGRGDRGRRSTRSAKRIRQVRLPPSYRDFLAASNGMLFEGALNRRDDARRAAEVDAAVEPPTLPGPRRSGFVMPDVAVPLDPTAGRPLCPAPRSRKAWMISSVEDGDVYLIFPTLAAPDGEWPVWFFGPKNPGAIGYRSFGHMLGARSGARALRALDCERAALR